MDWSAKSLIIFIIFTMIFQLSCFTSKQESTANIPLVSGFDLNRYTGTWYEIARLPHSFEKRLTKVTANYTIMPDEKIQVLNRGFDLAKGKWKEARGRAWIPDKQVPTRLRVSFFWIFAADYRIIKLDQEDYRYAVVTSNSKKYLWILSRTPQIEESLYTGLVKFAEEKGFDVNQLYKVPQGE